MYIHSVGLHHLNFFSWLKNAPETMSWFKRDSPLRSSFTKRLGSFSPPPKLDEGACLEVFQMHWQHAWNVMDKSRYGQQVKFPSADDVTSVVNHLDQMITLLLQEAHQCSINDISNTDQEINRPILDFLLMEGCLDKLFSWSVHCGEFANMMKLEQLKLYEVLVTNCHRDLLFHKPVVRPLLRLLALCGDCSPVEVEKRLIILLNTLCVCLTQFPDLLEVFFGASSDHGSTRSEHPRDMFLIFSLLIPFVHREGAIGQQARDALLLCMSLSRKNESIGVYIAEHSNFCPVLATGLSGLYSLLPRKLPVVAEDWHHFTPEDIAEMPELAMFLNSLEFCNAVIQVAHPMVQEQLLEYLYQGFLVPVLGPALHQDAAGVPVARLENTSKYLNTVDEITTATAYLELFLRTITEPMLLQVFLKFVLTSSHDNHCILNTLVERLGAQSKLCLATMALFRKLLDLNCEDVLFELILKYLIPCSHVMVSQRSRVRDVDIYSRSADKFLSLIPSCCIPDVPSEPSSPNKSVPSTPYPVGLKEMYSSLTNERTKGGSLRIKRHQRSPSTSSFSFGEYDRIGSPFFMGSYNHSTMYQRGLEMFQTNYMDYLVDAHNNIRYCALACRNWSAPYDGINPPPDFCKNALQNKELLFCTNLNNSVIQNGCKVSVNGVQTVHSAEETQRKDISLAQIKECAFSDNESGEIICSHLSPQAEKGIGEHHSNKTQAVVISDLGCSLDMDNSVDFSAKDEVLNTGTILHNSIVNTRSSSDFTVTRHGDDEREFWSLLSATKTPSSIADIEDSLEVIDFYVNQVEDGDIVELNTNKHWFVGDTYSMKDECSNVDSGVFESRESNCSSDRDMDPLPIVINCAKSNAQEDNFLWVTIPPNSSKLDTKLCSSTTSESSSKSSNSPVSPGSWESLGSPDIGPFLSILLTRLEMMMQNDVYTNLHLTGLLSRLAWYPQPLLRSFLLNHSLVFQPTVRSLLQVLGSLKHKVDSYSYTVDNYEELMIKAKQFLLAREEHLLINGPPRTYFGAEVRNRGTSAPDMHRGEPRRRSLSNILFGRGSILKGRERGTLRGPSLESISDGQGYRYFTKPTPDALEGEMESVKTRNAILCAVVLEEFLKELAAIAQEHSVIELDPDFWDKRWQWWDS